MAHAFGKKRKNGDLFELDNLLYIIESSIVESATQVLSDIQALIGTNLKHSPIILGSWVGGDRDGNPYVSNEIMTKVMKTAHRAIIEMYIKKCEKLIRELSLSSDLKEPSAELLQSLQLEKEQLPSTESTLYAKEPFRAKLYLIKKKLQNRLIAINTTDSIDFTYSNSKELLSDIDMLIRSLDSLSASGLVEFYNLVLLGGFHLLRLDFREHRDVILSATSEIFCLIGLCDSDFKDMSEQKKCEILNLALSAKKLDLNTILERAFRFYKAVCGSVSKNCVGKKAYFGIYPAKLYYLYE